ncbi:phage portal protein [Umezawaea tangerina]|uniref:HK97 family phage portal protein n=1 Tax=Umezawaea tangerina TaxID=84725 RepID=A0A2T0SPK3_9PSEU|nr:phage portal protein [Umezawaea tangerina]PRY35351.1 HK97 family phage portal protein [Umezawaea tangerina]
MRSPLRTVMNRVETISMAPPGSGGRSGWLGLGRSNGEGLLRRMGTSGIVYSIVSRCASSTSKATWHLYRSAESGKKEDRVEVTRHAALDLWNKPNRFMTRQELVEAGQQHIELTGESSVFVGYHPRFRSLPLELWPVQPHRVAPVPDPETFLAGYLYQSPSGETVPLELDQLLQIRTPNPWDPYHGLGPLQTVLTDADAGRYSAEWNLNFFLNGAEPGGIIELAKRMGPAEFREFRERWAEGHKGVANAHRVAMLTEGKWVDRKYTNRDMQLVEVRRVSRDTVMEAWGIHKISLGISDDVNKANAIAGKLLFAEDLTVPRLERWKGFLNNDLLPLYGELGTGLEFDYDSPVPADREADNEERTSKSEAVKTYIDAGFEPSAVLAAVGVPDMPVRAVAPAPAAAAPADVVAAVRRVVRAELVAANPGSARTTYTGCSHQLVRNVDETDIPAPPDGVPAEDPDAVESVDLTPMEEAFAAALAALVAAWVADIVAGWIEQLLAAVRDVLAAGDVSELAYLSVDTADAVEKLLAAMTELAASAADDVVAEAEAQETTVDPVTPAEEVLLAIAVTVAALEGQRYALAAGREAARMASGTLTDDEIADYVSIFLGTLAVSAIASALGGALTAAQNLARLATLAGAPVTDVYASEVLDKSTCTACHAIHGKWLGRTDDLQLVRKLYPAGGYVNCAGKARCRGTVVGIWRSTKEGAA